MVDVNSDALVTTGWLAEHLDDLAESSCPRAHEQVSVDVEHLDAGGGYGPPTETE